MASRNQPLFSLIISLCPSIVLGGAISVFPQTLNSFVTPVSSGYQTNSTKESQKFFDIEEVPNWERICRRFTDGLPQTDCNPDMITTDELTRKSGNYSFRIRGGKTLFNQHKITLPVKARTTYRLSTWVRVEDRKCYNYLDLDYPSHYVQNFARATKGIWCGTYNVSVHEQSGAQITEIPRVWSFGSWAWPQIAHSDIDWFHEDVYFKTSKEAKNMTLSVDLRGFDGKLWIDGLTLEKVESVIDDKYLHIPINVEFQGMKIKQIVQGPQGPLFVETNAAKFVFYGNTLKLQKNGEVIGSLTFKTSEFLKNLQLTQEPGLVVLENDNLIISAGADSTLLVKLKNNTEIIVDGKRPQYKNFEAGIIFATDYTKGLLFSPIYPESIIGTMPVKYNANIVDSTYNDSDFAKLGLKNWQVLADFSQSTWKVQYDFKKGGGFIMSVFPPKAFDEMKYCKERMMPLVTPAFDFNINPQSNPAYLLQKFSEYYKIALLDFNHYASINDQNPPTHYYLKSGMPVSPTMPDVVAVPLPPVDAAGPHIVKEEQAMHSFVNEAHRQGLKVLIGTSPMVFYTSNPDTILENLRLNIEKFSLDGVYFDGLIRHSPLKSLELVRKTRNVLRNKVFVLHKSWDQYLIRLSFNFRPPFYDVYADKLWVGEGIKKVDDNIWRLNYVGRNVSNTVSMLLSELRPVDYSLTPEASKAASLSPQQQIDKQLAYRGEFKVDPLSYLSFIRDHRFGTSMQFDSQYYWNKVDKRCLAKTCGDNICDVVETIYTCPKDCAPVINEAVMSRDGNTYICNTNQSVAQWIIDGKPFYQLHFTFDDIIARDDSENKMNPYPSIGVALPAPEPSQIDTKDVFRFNGQTWLFGTYDRTLDFTDNNFSLFAVIKRDNADSLQQVVFALDQQKSRFSYGIRASKLAVMLTDSNGAQKTFAGTNKIGQNWHTIGVVYEKPKLKLYVDGKKEREIEVLLDKFKPFGTYTIATLNSSNASPFKGYIDDLFVKDAALTDEQVAQYHFTGHKTITLSGDIKCILNKGERKYTAIHSP